MKTLTAVVMTVLLVIGSFESVGAQGKPAAPVVGKIAVTAKGDVSFDGKPVTIDVLKERLAGLKQRSGVVWYYREAGRGEPPAQATQVIKLVIDNRLPISMSTKPDFSDVLLPDGSTRPR
jgi:hypothetical protein